MRLRRIFNCGLPGSTVFFHVVSKAVRFSKKKKFIEPKMCVLIFYSTFVWNIYRPKKNWARYDGKNILVYMSSVRYSCQILIKIDFLCTDFRKILKYNI
jgi:hypothetical protein